MQKKVKPKLPRPSTFFGRNDELNRLLNMAQKKTASFIVIKGRRRIGKSRLVDEFSQHFQHYYKFEGLPPDNMTTAASELDIFCGQIARQFNKPKASYDDWSDAFWAIGEGIKSGKTLLFFDELSWMGSKESTFLGKIKSFWDNQASKNSQLIFIVCSSASSWIDKNLLSSTGFVGRISFILTLEELALFECNQFWHNADISAYEKFKILSVMGGVPKYLEEIHPKKSAEENVKELCFNRGSLLANEFNRIFSDLFLRNSALYKKIIYALSDGAKESSVIEKIVCRGEDRKHVGRISEYLWELVEAGFVSRDNTWNLKTTNDCKLSQYRLKDNYLRFYVKYMEKKLSKIERGAFSFKSLTALPEWHTIMGLQFENLVLNNRASIHKKLGIHSDDIVSENPFFQRKTARTAGCQIDYLIQTKFGSLYICEIKFSKNAINLSIIDEVKEKIKKLSRPKGLSCRPVLIHVNGVDDEVVDSDYFANIINMTELLENKKF